MKILRNTLLIGLAAVAVAAARAEDNQAVKDELAKLQGEWSMLSGSADGQAMPAEMLSSAKRVCKGDQLTVIIGGQTVMVAKITVDPAKKPKTIDYEVIDGLTKGKKLLGIYELEGDTLKSCFAAPDGERPKDFTGKEGERRTVSTWKHDKKAAAKPEEK
jgi:uncharacterized protein (TIGR03067 family)